MTDFLLKIMIKITVSGRGFSHVAKSQEPLELLAHVDKRATLHRDSDSVGVYE